MADLIPLPPRERPSVPGGDPVWEQALDWLLRLQANPEASQLRSELDTWLAASESHARAFRKARKVWQLSGDLDFTAPAVTRPRTAGWWKALVGGAIAASALLLALPDWTALRADHASAAGQHGHIELPDGSRIQLDSNSAIDVQFSAGERRVTLLRGQAFFEVSPDPQRPFRVTADQVEVTVTGTSFDVSLDEKAVSVAVEHGSVRVDSPASDSEPETLQVGERLRLARNGDGLRRDRLPAEQIGAWRDWQLLIDDQPLAEVVETLRRYQPGVILLNDPVLADRRITAALNLRAPRDALQAAIEPLGGQLQSWTPYVLVISAR